MADSGALMTTDRATVTCAGSPTDIAAKIPTRTIIPRVNRIIGRINSPPSRRAFDGANLRLALRADKVNHSLFQRKRLQSARQKRGRAGHESFAADHRGVRHLRDLGRLGHYRHL